MAEVAVTTSQSASAEAASMDKVGSANHPAEESAHKTPSMEETTAENDNGCDGKQKTNNAEFDVDEEPAPPAPILTTSGKKRPPYKYDPEKVTLRFIFANRDGLAVTIECKPADTVGEVKGALLSVWPDELPNCSGGDRVRLVCMGKGILMPDTRTLEDCQVPVFKTHPTPINVSVKPENLTPSSEKVSRNTSSNNQSGSGRIDIPGTAATSQGCACTIL